MKKQSPQKQTDDLTDSALCGFAHYRPRVFARVLRLPFLIGSLLNWRASSKTLLWHLLSLLDDEKDFLEVPHSDLALSLWPDLSVHSGKNKLTKWLGRFDEDQHLSCFPAIDRKRGHYKELNNGKEFFPSQYRLNAFYAFAEAVGDEIMRNEVVEIEALKMRHAAHRKIVAEKLFEMGAKSILAEARLILAEARLTDKKRKEGVKSQGVVIGSPEFQRLSLTERVEFALSQMFDVSKVCFDLVGEMESLEEAEYVVRKTLGYQAMNANAALEHRRLRQKEANKPRGVKRLSVVKPDPSEFKGGKLIGETLAKVKLGR